jgi:UDP-N-acetylmuramoyl-L-alanyl-D-glutamate--2,6-diaminopimelate ligase
MIRLKNLFPQKLKNIYHLARATFANFLYGFPSRKIKVIGVTGTNGKTTTCQMIARILEEAGYRVALASTINFKIGEKEWVNKTKFTTLSPFAVQKFIKQAIKAGCQYLVLETSSHSLDQNRVWGIEYDTAVITNVTREHLDYHKTMEEYRKAKLKLFRKVKTAIVNLDMERPEEFLQSGNEIKYAFTCHPERIPPWREKSKDLIGLDSSTELGMTYILAENIELKSQNTRYKIQDTNFLLNIPGLFNIENALAAICVGLNYGVNLETSSRALEKIKGIPGRMEYVENNKGLNIIIDYAVTPDSLEKLYELIKTIRLNSPQFVHNSRIISVFGSCGERDRGKRPIMGGIVAKSADYIIVTNEDPYNENPQRIIDEVFSGIPLCHPERIPNNRDESKDLTKNEGIPKQARDEIFCFTENVNCWRILDRREAIKKALQIAKPGDYVIVTGKGAEETMAVGKAKISWNDKKVIQEELSKLP